jgi:beta-xylosidase
MYAHTQNIWDENSWSEPIYVDQPGFDPDLFFDDDGKVYLTTALGAPQIPDSGYFAIWMTEIDINTGDSLVESEVFHISTLPLDTPRLAEGSHIFKKDGWYYCMTAEAGTSVQHREMIIRSKSIKGPWEENPNNPILFNGKRISAHLVVYM